MTVARLFSLTPEKFGRSCKDCKTFVYDERSGRRSPDRSRPGESMRRTRTMGDPPCHECGKTIGLEVRHYSFAHDPPDWCYKTFRHWRAMEAIQWQASEASDPIIRRNALLFNAVRDAQQRGRDAGILEVLGLVRR